MIIRNEANYGTREKQNMDTLVHNYKKAKLALI